VMAQESIWTRLVHSKCVHVACSKMKVNGNIGKCVVCMGMVA